MSTPLAGSCVNSGIIAAITLRPVDLPHHPTAAVTPCTRPLIATYAAHKAIVDESSARAAVTEITAE